MPVAEEAVSPELVLVSPPEVAAQAREALPDYEEELERWMVQARAARAAPTAEPAPEEPSYTAGAFVFTVLAAATAVAPLVFLLLFR